MIGWACLADGDGTKAGMSRLPIPKWIRRRRLAPGGTAGRGTESSTARGWYLFRAGSRGTISSTLGSEVRAFFWATGASITGARTLLRLTTRSTCGEGFTPRLAYSTSTIRATTVTGDR